MQDGEWGSSPPPSPTMNNGSELRATSLQPQNQPNGFVLFSNNSNCSNTSSSDMNPVVDKPSNQRLLGTAFVSFMSFALLQLSFAFVADSEAMKGDSAAMIVDALTYLFNYIAEYRKHHFQFTDVASSDENNKDNNNNNNNMDETRTRRLQQRAYRKMVLQMEVMPPLVSVSTLMVVTAVVSYQSVQVFVHSTPGKPREDPNIHLMMAFSILNLALDILNVFCFAKAKHLTGYSTTDEPALSSTRRGASRTTGRYVRAQDFSNSSSHDEDEEMDDDHDIGIMMQQHKGGEEVEESHRYHSRIDVSSGNHGNSNHHHQSTLPDRLSQDSSEGSYDDIDHIHQQHTENTNLNMCSAYTHVFADTLRSIAVILAACLAEFVPTVTAEEADASAALIVSLLIVLSLIPLFQGLIMSGSELRGIFAEEKSEVMLQQSQAPEHELT